MLLRRHYEQQIEPVKEPVQEKEEDNQPAELVKKRKSSGK